jgi:ABC-type polysaccharide/polyol phosphate transport system ATPase subunit
MAWASLSVGATLQSPGGQKCRFVFFTHFEIQAITPPMPSVISVSNLSKTYASGFKALNNVSLDINRGEIFALLGPNGAGKTTLISIICGIANPT